MTQGLAARAIYSVSQGVLESEAPKAENVRRGLKVENGATGTGGPSNKNRRRHQKATEKLAREVAEERGRGARTTPTQGTDQGSGPCSVSRQLSG